jgi:hypothetical protein
MTKKVKRVIAHYCEKKHDCKWQGFHFHRGLSWGEVPDENDTWRQWHDKGCGGKLIPIIEEAEVESWFCYELPGVSWGYLHESSYQKILREEGKEEAFKFASQYGWTIETINKRNSI